MLFRSTADELVGFTFCCSEKDKNNRGKIVWRGKITLLEDDMRRIGRHLAELYWDALSNEAHRHARSIREVAAWRPGVGDTTAGYSPTP